MFFCQCRKCNTRYFCLFSAFRSTRDLQVQVKSGWCQFCSSAANLSVYLSDDTRDRQYGEKKVQLAKTPQFAIYIQPILLLCCFECDCPSYFKCADSSEICPPLLFIWGWLDINCVPNLCYSSKQTLPIPPHFQISKHILEFNQGCRSRKSSEKHIPSVIFEFILITFQILGMTT